MLLNQAEIEHKSIEIDQLDNGREIQYVLYAMTKRPTVPNIFIDQKQLGGYNELEEAYHTGKLKEILDEADIKHNL